MAFSLGTLTAYTDQTSQELLTATLFKSETAKMAGLQVGIKSSRALQLLSNTAFPQDGSTCAFNASGTTTLTQRVLTTSAIKFQSTWCVRDLEAYWTQVLVSNGQSVNEADIPAQVWTNLSEEIQKQLETADWKGDTTSGTAEINRYDGLIKIIKAVTGTVTATASTYNLTNARAIVANIVYNIPAALKGNQNVKIYMGYDAAETYRQALMNANLYHVAVGSKDQHAIMAEGSVHEIVPVHGLDGLTGNTGDNPFIFALDLKNNAFMGTDMLDEEEDFKSGLDQYEENVWYTVRFRRGWQIAFPSQIVEYSNS